MKIILVLSAKGGVGKTTVSYLLAMTLSHNNNRVGILDGDLTNPNVHVLLDTESNMLAKQGKDGRWEPVVVYQDNQKILVLSTYYITTSKTKSIVLKPAKKQFLLQKLLKGTNWENVDYLIIDTFPGVTMEHEVLFKLIHEMDKDYKTVLVTTSQKVAVEDNKKIIDLCNKNNILINGIVENMSGYNCKNCGNNINIFSKKGGRHLSDEYEIPFLGEIEYKEEEVNMNEIENILNKLYLIESRTLLVG
eukprot:GHVP01063594.1.p1 GENE.GHVP01063594.1~~GHVP01063594.1.p1  ORF type:complete len:248 (+),score=43.32 GHVP01063594.1:213-956(+)